MTTSVRAMASFKVIQLSSTISNSTPNLKLDSAKAVRKLLKFYQYSVKNNGLQAKGAGQVIPMLIKFLGLLRLRT
jgi:hypothetical protein